tara:strand:- start:1450 stop:1623 length:174 start_codon:yes stop_codon:yes gene_type:complete
MSKTGIIEITMKLYLDMDVDEDQARDIVENGDYNFSHPLVVHTEIIADDIQDRIEMG